MPMRTSSLEVFVNRYQNRNKSEGKEEMDCNVLSLSVSQMNPLMSLRSVAAVISLLELCLQQEPHGLPGKQGPEAAPTLLLQHLIELCANTDAASQSLGDSQHEQKLKQLAQDCLAEANILRSHLKPQHGFSNEIMRQRFLDEWDEAHTIDKFTLMKNRLVSLSSKLKSWLIDAMSDATIPFSASLEAMQKEAESISSARSDEILHLRRDMMFALGILSDNVSERISKKHSRKARQAILSSSSENLGQESNTPTRIIRRPKTRRHGNNQQKLASSRPLVASLVTILLWLAPLKNSLTALFKLSEVLPWEVHLLKQLSFESVSSREDSIHEAESGTFQWLFNESTDMTLTQNMVLAKQSFISWLTSGSGIFHISGKAGSGKSTLMKFLRHHPRTRSELELWAGDRKLVFSGFYFWNSGSSLQMSLEGLYRSILLEVSRQCPNLMPTLFPAYWELFNSVSSDQLPESSISDPERIREAFEILCGVENDLEYRMCFFIDGLDEYTGENIDYWALAKNLRDWTESSGVKLCVSARPYPEFLSTFSSELSFHLHELTSCDLQAFASNSFRSIQNLDLPQNGLGALVQSVVHGSEGVFLWARIVVRSLLRLANSGSTILQLLEAAGNYPSEINELYDFLLGSLEPQDMDQAKDMLSLAIGNPFSQPLNALCFSWMDELDDSNFPAVSPPYSVSQVKKRHEDVRRQVEWLTKGLLEMHTDRRERKEGDQFYRQRVQFSHRTARDYLRSPGRFTAAQNFLKGPGSETYAKLRLAEIVLAGKYRVTPGADPRRRRLYSNLLRSLFNLRDHPGKRYQIPQRLMRILESDLKTTVTDSRFSGPYAISGLKSISDPDVVDEDPEKAASFLHFAVSYGQQNYAIQELGEKPHIAAPSRELSLLLSAAFGHRKWPLAQFTSLLTHSPALTTKIKIRPSLGYDPFASTSFEEAIRGRRIEMSSPLSLKLAKKCLLSWHMFSNLLQSRMTKV
ncbi:hypothetical protein N431DRAFT_557141 [Stipitochalara longipes BDJ]|nr:hypothetical protein N431DRAFT_557141 [Stipitochalara longipes BDJ]